MVLFLVQWTNLKSKSSQSEGRKRDNLTATDNSVCKTALSVAEPGFPGGGGGQILLKTALKMKKIGPKVGCAS